MAAKLSYRPKSKVLHRDRVWTIVRAVTPTSVLIEDTTTGETDVVNVTGLQLPEPKEVEAARRSSPRPKDEQSLAEAKRRMEIIKPLLDVPEGRTEAVEAAAKSAGISTATLFRWIKLYRDGGQLSYLAPLRRGRAMPSRLDAKVETIIQSVIDEYYLTRQQRSGTKAIEEVERRCRAAGLKPPHANSIRKRLRAVHPRDALAKRRGRKEARDKHGEVKGEFPEGRWPLDVVQIDHTLLDLILVDEEFRQPIGRPWLTLAIDVFSRMVVGYHISLDAPSAFGVGLCLCHAFLPKEAELDRLGIKGEWPVWGIMTKIHADNGKDFRSATLKRSCEEYGIDIQWRPVRTPHFGGHIERLMGTVAKEIHALPGTTFANPKQRGEYDSDARSIMTLPEIRRWLVQFIVGVYHKREHRGIGMPPIERWREGILGNGRQKGTGLPEPVSDPRRLRIDFLPFEERTVQRDGIVWDKVAYYGDVIRPWINVSHGRQKRKFVVRRDPTDISRVYVLDPDQNEYFEVPYRDLTKPSISIWEYRAAEKFLSDRGIKGANEDEIFEARQEMLRIEEEAQKETKRKRRNRERKKHHAEIALPPAPSPDPAPDDRRNDGHLSLVVDNTTPAAKPGRGKPRGGDSDFDFDFDEHDVKTGVEEW
ncbi:DDE-type integrase/transposase/recombinase [Azospirillum sp. YIM DDC1]|uniref:DDE-type integrase/transposase/recombinase n=1 Tax=Azospirillum aestuarii TaxID=2802052 RepID=A0ABS1I7T3_9PROT|nr:Mu transposase C-terminal domain-containing protein [Azospirillum aestuarii]MBK4723075.1 DDE-type integrase/transposase/recombinase [Azospirillum aestuarii]